jgi:RHS repeat-associated protein
VLRDARGPGTLLLQADSTTGSTLFLGATELHETTGSSTASAVRTYTANGTPIAERTTAVGVSGSKLTWLATDAQGTVDLQVDAVTGVVASRLQDPFGQARGTSTAAWSDGHGFLNATTDALTSLTQLGARMYDASLGRFLSVDPVLSPSDPQQNNGYSYAHNSPVSMSDPTGLDPNIASSCSSLACRNLMYGGSSGKAPAAAGNTKKASKGIALSKSQIAQLGDAFSQRACQIGRATVGYGGSCNAAEGAASDDALSGVLSGASDAGQGAFALCMADFANPYCGDFETADGGLLIASNALKLAALRLLPKASFETSSGEAVFWSGLASIHRPAR